MQLWESKQSRFHRWCHSVETRCRGQRVHRRGAHCNSTHTLQLVNTAQYDPVVFLNSVKLNSSRSYVSNSDGSHFNHLIEPAPFIEDSGSSIYENNGPSSVQNFEMEQWGPGADLNLHLHMHVLLWSLWWFSTAIAASQQELREQKHQLIRQRPVFLPPPC